jgi:hypothetical protein
MRDRDLKAVVISALRPSPDFSKLHLLRGRREAQLKRLLLWLDQSGLALYLLSRLQQHEVLDGVPSEFRRALERRLGANRERTLDLLGEFGRLVESFDTHGVRFCALKGFTLTPDFCPAAHLRHQTDFDFLVAAESIETAKRALESCGYATEESSQRGRLTFATPLRHIPSPRDNIYARPRHREVDLLTSLRHEAQGVSVDGPSDWLTRLQCKRLNDISFHALSVEDMFHVQVLHAFKHLLGSWVRASWLLEIGYFIDRHYANADLWRSIATRAGQEHTVRDAFGLIVSLTNTLFPRPIPPTLQEWCLEPLSGRIETWVSQFGLRSVVSDLHGTKLTLFVHREFVQNPGSWNSYIIRRMFPIRRQSSIGSVASVDLGTRIMVKASQSLHVMRRMAFHARELVSLPVEAIRWKFALRSVERQRALVSAGSH